MTMEKTPADEKIVRVTIAMLSGARHFFDMKLAIAKSLEESYRERSVAHLCIKHHGASYTISTKGIESFTISNRTGE